MKRYEITIKETVTETRVKGKEWCKGANPPNGDEGYGYTPEISKDVEVTREVYTQNTDDLDLKEVIRAINNL